MLQLFCWHLYKSEAGFSTVDFHGSGTSKVHVGISGISFGEHPLVSQAVQTVTTIALIPVTFNIVPVLTYVLSLHTTGMSLHLLSSIALFLTVPNCSFFLFQSKLCGLPWTSSPGAER